LDDSQFFIDCVQLVFYKGVFGIKTSIEFWWVLVIGTLVFLTLSVVIITAIGLSRNRLLKVQKDKLNVVEASEKKYKNLVESIDDAVFVVDAKGKILFINSVFTNILKSNQESIRGKNLKDVFTDKSDVASLIQCINRVFNSGKPEKAEHQIYTGHSSYWFETKLVPRLDSSGDFVSLLCISRDMTVRRQTEDERKKLVATLESQQKTLKSLATEVIKAQESERARISRDLHDEFGQALTAISINLEIMNQSQSLEVEELKSKILDCKKIVKKTMRDIHRFSFELRPTMLDDLGLLPAIRSHIRGFSNRTGIDVEMDGDRTVNKLDEDIKTILYRVMQEALNNVAKHSAAHKVSINIRTYNNSIILDIKDDGVGFDPYEQPSTISEEGGLGLQGIRERVRIVGGNLSISSKQNSGTTLKVDIPYGKA